MHPADPALAADTAPEALAALRDPSPRTSGAARQVLDSVAGRMFPDAPATKLGRHDSEAGRTIPGAPAAVPRLGRFERPTMISYGGMGVVHRAFDPVLGRPVAIKLCRPDRPHSDRDVQRLLAEARVLATLDHPNVVAVHEAGHLPDGQIYVALEHVEGEDLARWLTRPRPWQDVVAAFVQAARGLEAVHRRGLVHRDIKPANLLRRPDGVVKLIDFGLVKAVPADDPPDATHAASDALHTETGRVLGTRGYLAPELYLGAAPSVASDIFALCVALYIGLYNRRPFVGTPRAHSSRAATRPGRPASEPPDLRDILGPFFEPARGERGVPPRVVAILRRGLAPRPADRHPSVTALIAALDPGPAARTTRLAAASVLLAALAGAAWARPVDAPACSRVADELADIQTPRISIDGDPGTAALGRQLTRYTEAWTAARTSTCRARHDQRETPAVLDARNACLDRAAQQLRAVVARLPENPADPEQLATLSDPQDCLAPQIAAQACHAVPDDPTLRAAVARVDAAIADARASQIVGDFNAAVDLAEHAVDAADSVDLRGLQARARLALGDALRTAGHDRRATAVLLAARDAAQESLCVDVHADALDRLNQIAALSGGTAPALVDERVAVQRALARALGPAHDRIADAEHTAALVALHLHHDAPAAEAGFTAAIDARLHLPELDAHAMLALADSHLGLAGALARRGRHDAADEAIRSSIAHRTVAVGADHPSMSKPYLNWGHRLLERRDFIAAEAAYTRALTFTGNPGRARTRVLTGLAALAERRGDLDAALRHAREAAAALDEHATAVDRDAAENLAQILTEVGDPDAAIPILTRTLAERDHAADGLSVGATRTRLADAHLAAGRPAPALEQASLALTDLHHADPRDPNLAFAHLARGEALVDLADTPDGLHMPAPSAADAASSLAQAIHIWTLRADNPARLAWSQWQLARVRCEAQHSRDDGRAAATAARDLADPADAELRTTIDLWLRTTCP